MINSIRRCSSSRTVGALAAGVLVGAGDLDDLRRVVGFRRALPR